VSVGALVPPNVLSYDTRVDAHKTNNDNTTNVAIRLQSSQDWFTHDALGGGFSGWRLIHALTIPNVSQRFFYAWTAAPTGSTAGGLTVDILGYRVPNGDA